ncbi:MAG: hypothetical protein ACI4D6_06835 [Chordicoccus sp.]
MNSFINWLEKKLHGRAIPHLTACMIGLFVIGYLLTGMGGGVTAGLTLNIYKVLHGQIWRLVTWLLIPPSSFDIFTIIMLLFYLSIGVSLERTWGDFRYNVYIIGGLLITILSAFVTYIGFTAAGFNPAEVGAAIGAFYSTYYVCMSIMLAYAATFPNAEVLLFFVIPIRMKWLGWMYFAFIAYDCITYIRLALSAAGSPLYWIHAIAVVASLLNFILFWFEIRNGGVHLSRSQRETRRQFRAQQRSMGSSGSKVVQMPHARHRCEVCGRTDISNPELEFRYCSKCDGAHEYCMDHLYTHQHIHYDNDNLGNAYNKEHRDQDK